jgi:hypothetical protein
MQYLRKWPRISSDQRLLGNLPWDCSVTPERQIVLGVRRSEPHNYPSKPFIRTRGCRNEHTALRRKYKSCTPMEYRPTYFSKCVFGEFAYPVGLSVLYRETGIFSNEEIEIPYLDKTMLSVRTYLISEMHVHVCSVWHISLDARLLFLGRWSGCFWRKSQQQESQAISSFDEVSV